MRSRRSWPSPLTWKRVIYLLKHHVRKVELVAARFRGYYTLAGLCGSGLPIFDVKVNIQAGARDRVSAFFHEIAHIHLEASGYSGQGEWVEGVCEECALEFCGKYPQFAEFLFRKMLQRAESDMPVCEDW